MNTQEKNTQQAAMAQLSADEYARTAITSIREMLDALEHSRECDGTNEAGEPCAAGPDSEDPDAWHDEERALQRILEDPLSVETRSEWHEPGSDSEESEYCILITTGGPAARITGGLDEGQPTSARFEYQDWFTPWTVAHTTHEENSALLAYAQCFYFGG